MKISLFLLSLVIVGIVISYINKKEEPEADNTSSEETRTTHPTADLIRKKIKLEQQLESLIAKTNLDGNKELQGVKDEAKEADLHFYTVQRQHPKLQKLYKKAAGWQGRNSSNYPAQKAKAAKMMLAINTEIAKISASLPEVQAARAAQAAARKRIHTKKRELAENLPEAKGILAELAEIDAQLVAQQP